METIGSPLLWSAFGALVVIALLVVALERMTLELLLHMLPSLHAPMRAKAPVKSIKVVAPKPIKHHRLQKFWESQNQTTFPL